MALLPEVKASDKEWEKKLFEQKLSDRAAASTSSGPASLVRPPSGVSEGELRFFWDPSPLKGGEDNGPGELVTRLGSFFDREAVRILGRPGRHFESADPDALAMITRWLDAIFELDVQARPEADDSEAGHGVGGRGAWEGAGGSGASAARRKLLWRQLMLKARRRFRPVSRSSPDERAPRCSNRAFNPSVHQVHPDKAKAIAHSAAAAANVGAGGGSLFGPPPSESAAGCNELQQGRQTALECLMQDPVHLARCSALYRWAGGGTLS